MTTKKVRAPRSTAKQEKRANGQGSIYFDRSKNRYVVAVPDPVNANRRRKKFFYTKKEFVPWDNPHWSSIGILNLDDYLNNEGQGLKIDSKIMFSESEEKHNLDSNDSED